MVFIFEILFFEKVLDIFEKLEFHSPDVFFRAHPLTKLQVLKLLTTINWGDEKNGSFLITLKMGMRPLWVFYLTATALQFFLLLLSLEIYFKSDKKNQFLPKTCFFS
jgi:hypothetical protein